MHGKIKLASIERYMHTDIQLESSIEMEKKKMSVSAFVSTENKLFIINKYSNLEKLHHVVACILNFKNNRLACKKKKTKVIDALNLKGVKDATNIIIKLLQNQYFHKEILYLKYERAVLLKSKVR